MNKQLKLAVKKFTATLLATIGLYLRILMRNIPRNTIILSCTAAVCTRLLNIAALHTNAELYHVSVAANCATVLALATPLATVGGTT
jgi:hypothetical protein